MTRPVLRFAPSPNGALHLGHAYSALLNFEEARRTGGRFLVRIEDIDWIRCTAALAERALADLAWLGLRWDEPVRRQSEHLADYRSAQDRLAAKGLLYPCFCSRGDIARAGSPGARDPEGAPLYPGTCKRLDAREREARIAKGRPHALRLDMTAAISRLEAPVVWNEFEAGPVRAAPERWGDVVLARKDIGTSYHMAAVVDDALQGITDVIRGRDLREATAIHRILQELLGLPAPGYRHHRLIETAEGRKLAKSAGDPSLASLRAAGVTSGDIWRQLGFA